MTYIEYTNSRFDFGKFLYCTIIDVMTCNPSYLTWLLKNVSGDRFFIAPRVMEQIRYLSPSFVFTKELLNCYAKRKEEFEAFKIEDDKRKEKEERTRRSWDQYYESLYSTKHNEDTPTYEKYNGSYAQDVMGYSDDEIDTIFDGDPSAYWNID